MKKTLGIIGGMGPLATADLFYKIISLTNAMSDREHIHILVDSNTNIPDRTEAILYAGEDPLPEIVGSAHRLANAGAQILMLACNTAHFYFPKITDSVDLPILNMLEETAIAAKKRGIAQIGLLATDATLQMQLYHKALAKQKIDVTTPAPEEQKCVMDLIYKSVKAGDFSFNITSFLQILQHMREKGAETFILGCTELPIAFQRFSIPFPSIDPTDVLARAAIAAAGYEVKK